MTPTAPTRAQWAAKHIAAYRRASSAADLALIRITEDLARDHPDLSATLSAYRQARLAEPDVVGDVLYELEQRRHERRVHGYRAAQAWRAYEADRLRAEPPK